MNTAVILVALGIALLVYLLTPVGPTRDRSKPFRLAHERTSRLAIMREGATLTVLHVPTGKRLQFRKTADDGGVEQELALLIRETDVGPQGIDVLKSILLLTPSPWQCEIDEVDNGRVLICYLRGQPMAISHMARELFHRLCQPLSIAADDRVEVTLEGVEDYAIWRRLNARVFDSMAESPSPLTRLFGRWQKRKHDSERRNR